MTKRKKPEDKLPVGRPTDYCEAMSLKICAQLSMGRSLRKTCEMDGMPSVLTVLTWLNRHPEFLAQYERAKAECADTYADDIVDIADDAMNIKTPHLVQAARLRVDARKWIASKLKPKKYGERVHTEVSGTMSLEQIVATTGIVKDTKTESDGDA